MPDIFVEACVLAADVGLALLFYKYFSDQTSAADKIEKMEKLEIDDNLQAHLKSMPGKVLEYGHVEGAVASRKEPLHSKYADARGPIRIFKQEIHKSTRHRGVWTDEKDIISSHYDKVPFVLTGLGGASILVTEPKSAQYLEEALIATHDHFQPSERSIWGSLFDKVSGDITKGIRTHEQVLKEDTVLNGFGKLVLDSNNNIELRPPNIKGANYIVTSLSKTELVSKLRSSSLVYKVLAGIFGVTGIIILWVSLAPRIKEWVRQYKDSKAVSDLQEQLQRMQDNGGAVEFSSENSQCVICLEANRQILLRPCGHVCSCISCYQAMPSPKKCPVCRAAIDEILPIYIP